jgi:hypothetical protein
MPAKLNETGTPASDRVHVREIVVIFGIDGGAGGPQFHLIACRSAASSI